MTHNVFSGTLNPTQSVMYSVQCRPTLHIVLAILLVVVPISRCCVKAKFHYAILLAKQLVSWFASRMA